MTQPAAQHLERLLELSESAPAFRVKTLRGRTSNGYLEYIYRRTAKEILNHEIPVDVPLSYKQGKNRHYQEVTFEDLPLKMVTAYGF